MRRPDPGPSLMLLCLCVALTSQGFSSGKIRGIVSDGDTKTPLIGANIVVEGTSFGAVSDTQGGFALINLPAGEYSLRASYIGYAQTRLEKIRVFNNLISKVNIELRPEQIELRVVTVIAQRPLLNPSSTNALRITTAEDIRQIPLRELNDILSLQPGVTLQDGIIHIRGGRADEVGYYLEGVSITDPQFGGRQLSLMQDAIEEIAVQSSGYQAEFGRANAGIIHHQLRTGGEFWRGTVEYITDNVTFQGKENWGNGKRRLGAYWYGHNELTATTGGPVVDEHFRAFGLFNYAFQRDKHPQPYAGVNLGPVKDPFSGDSINLVYPAAVLLKNSTERYSAVATFAADFFPLMLKLSGSYTSGRSFGGSTLENILNVGRTPQIDRHDWFASLKGTYFLDPKTFIEFTGGYFSFSEKTFDPALGDDFLAYGDSVANAAAGYVWERGPRDNTSRFTLPRVLSIYGFQFFPAGFPLSPYEKFQRNNFSFTGAFSTQIGDHHTIKAGGDYQRFTLRSYRVRSPANLAIQINLNDRLPDSDPRKLTLEEILIANSVDNYGYDVLGNVANTDDFLGPRHPVFASAYLQDRMEFGDLVLNLGIRYDYINTRSTPFLDPTRPELTIDYQSNRVKPEGILESTPFQALSPRFGAAFSLAEKTVFHVQYAKMVQQSRLRDVNLGMYAVGGQLLRGGGSSPIGFDLRPTRTTQYEIGFSQQIGDFAALDITAYYRDIRDEITMKPVEPAAGSPYIPYAAYTNGDFATAKGVEVSFTMRRQKRLEAHASLSFQNAEGSGSFPNSNRGIVLSGRETTFNPHYISPLSYNHAVSGNLNLDYRFAREDGGPILQELGLSMLVRFNSGHPYTRITPESNEYNAVSRRPAEALNSSTTPWVFQVDLRLDKTFRVFEPLSTTVYVYVLNLLDTKNVTNVFMATGSPDDSGWLSNPTGGAVLVDSYGPVYADLRRGFEQYYRPVGYFNDPYFYGTPRQIRLGLRLEF